MMRPMAARMHADEVDTDADLVRRLLADRHPAWADRPIERVPSAGTDNALYRLGDDLVVRLPRINWAAGHLDRQAAWLPVLAPHVPVRVPVPVAVGEPAHGYPWRWSVWPWLAGAHPEAGSESLARELATFVRALRTVAVPADAPVDRRGRSLRERDADVRAGLARLVDEVDVEAVQACWDHALAAPEWVGPAVWLHTDLTPVNLLCVGGRLDAVIDWTPGVGDPAADLIPAWNLFDGAARRAYLAAVAPDAATIERGRGRALEIAVVALPYYRDTNPWIAASARRVIAEVLADRG